MTKPDAENNIFMMLAESEVKLSEFRASKFDLRPLNPYAKYGIFFNKERVDWLREKLGGLSNGELGWFRSEKSNAAVNNEMLDIERCLRDIRRKLMEFTFLPRLKFTDEQKSRFTIIKGGGRPDYSFWPIDKRGVF